MNAAKGPKTVSKLIAAAKAGGAKMNYGSGGVGGSHGLWAPTGRDFSPPTE